ncbi:MAG: MAPEG family protein [Gammaproteobacteria bacterium]|nr:MAPEG family protein [Gammaproteobacteria bacterium]
MFDFSLLYPMALLVALTFFILFNMLYLRIKAVRTRQLSPRYFRLNEGGNVSDKLKAVTQNYNNLLELPILFYVVCVLAILLNKNNDYFVLLAWGYVFLRVIHSAIHVTYNNIMHRLSVFALSCIVLVMMWIKVVLLSVMI